MSLNFSGNLVLSSLDGLHPGGDHPAHTYSGVPDLRTDVSGGYLMLGTGVVEAPGHPYGQHSQHTHGASSLPHFQAEALGACDSRGSKPGVSGGYLMLGTGGKKPKAAAGRNFIKFI